ncbi:MAG TPA: glycogen/starch synthase [Verrucomicrobiales bacterium]|nr:glycogen/starch synthase [Verrucomicrobiales bacterium]
MAPLGAAILSLNTGNPAAASAVSTGAPAVLRPQSPHKPLPTRAPTPIPKPAPARRKGEHPSRPRILVVTPEITYLPEGMGNMTQRLSAKAGGLADVSASLVSHLYEMGADVHVALPNYRHLFHVDVWKLLSDELRTYKSKLPDARIHLAEDRIFYYRDQIYGYRNDENPKISLAFQREVINNILPRVEPDLIHCNDWMTGLIPAAARRLSIPCLFTVHNIHTERMTLAEMEERGIDAAEFWPFLYFQRPPASYEESRSANQVDLLASGIFAAHFINTVSPAFLDEIVEGHHSFIPEPVRTEIANKKHASVAQGILNAPDPSFHPASDRSIVQNFDAGTFSEGKRRNKIELQKRLKLLPRPDAPLLFWPSRLDPIQKGCQLFADVLYETIDAGWEEGLQVAIIANGSFQEHFRDIAAFHGIANRLAVVDFEENLSRLGYAASDFLVMPSLFEPCGLPQMIAPLYGSLPIVHDTGGLHDTIHHLDLAAETGNGFVFRHYDTQGLRWAIGEALRFYRLDLDTRHRHIRRIMQESAAVFHHGSTAKQYLDIYERMLARPLVAEG